MVWWRRWFSVKSPRLLGELVLTAAIPSAGSTETTNKWMDWNWKETNTHSLTSQTTNTVEEENKNTLQYEWNEQNGNEEEKEKQIDHSTNHYYRVFWLLSLLLATAAAAVPLFLLLVTAFNSTCNNTPSTTAAMWIGWNGKRTYVRSWTRARKLSTLSRTQLSHTKRRTRFRRETFTLQWKRTRTHTISFIRWAIIHTNFHVRRYNLLKTTIAPVPLEDDLCILRFTCKCIVYITYSHLDNSLHLHATSELLSYNYICCSPLLPEKDKRMLRTQCEWNCVDDYDSNISHHKGRQHERKQ